MYNKYDISRSSYSEAMGTKETQYRALVNQAERLRVMNGVPTKEEGKLYQQAGAVCGEIMSMNLTQRAVYAQWQHRKEECEENMQEIVRYLAPGAVAAQAAKDFPIPPMPSDDGIFRPERKAEIPAGGKQAAAAKNVNTAPSGFTTKNAVKDVPADVIEKWYKEKPNHTFDDVTGMQEQKERLMRDVADLGWELTDESLHISSIHGYLFYGPPGGGKTFLIEAFARELMEQGFKYIKLIGSEIHASLVGVAEKTVQIAFQEAIDNSPCILFIDELDNVCADRSNPKAEANEKRLTNAFLEAWNTLKEYGKNVVFIGATNYPDLIDSAMMDRVKLVKAPLPSEEERIAYFKRKFGKFTLEPGFGYDSMVDATDNTSYRDLDRLSDAVNSAIKMDMIHNPAYQVYDAMGQIDQKETDRQVSDAINNGGAELTAALFEKMRKENPPSDKTKIRESLERFERKASAVE